MNLGHNNKTTTFKQPKSINLSALMPSILLSQTNGVTVRAVVREVIEPERPLTATIYQIPTQRLPIVVATLGVFALIWLLLRRKNNLLVIDRYSQEPIENLRIQIVERDTVTYSTTTNSKGKCHIPELAKLPTLMLSLKKIDSFLIINKPTKPITILEI